MGQQRLNYERFDACVMQPRRERPAKVMQGPRRHCCTGLYDPSVQCFLGLAPTREPTASSPEYTALGVLRALRQRCGDRGEQRDLVRDRPLHSLSADEEPLLADLLPTEPADFFAT